MVADDDEPALKRQRLEINCQDPSIKVSSSLRALPAGGARTPALPQGPPCPGGAPPTASLAARCGWSSVVAQGVRHLQGPPVSPYFPPWSRCPVCLRHAVPAPGPPGGRGGSLPCACSPVVNTHLGEGLL